MQTIKVNRILQKTQTFKSDEDNFMQNTPFHSKALALGSPLAKANQRGAVVWAVVVLRGMCPRSCGLKLRFFQSKLHFRRQCLRICEIIKMYNIIGDNT